ncbi:MAG: sulfatase-like hydrolase/transferase, partial [Candidatus Hydrogenedentes bacterium]|nr:sulfatase-like hydrolase/transferase [Candidatus Hydrogenedentota bacterium]
HTPNYHFRGRKSDVWEGGHHVPFLVRWPSNIKAGTSTDETTCLSDLLATCADLLGKPMPVGVGEDSVSMWPAFQDKISVAPLRDHTIHHSINGVFALRQGPWKFIDNAGSGGWSSNGKAAPGPNAPKVQLYKLDDDIGEQKNRWADEPQKVAALKQLLEESKK